MKFRKKLSGSSCSAERLCGFLNANWTKVDNVYL